MKSNRKYVGNDAGTLFRGKKDLMLNGYSAIRCCTAALPGPFFLEENVLLIVKEGSFKFQYGNTRYEAGRSQMAFLKKDSLIFIETDNPPNELLHVEYILFSLTYDLVKEFVKLAELSIAANDKALTISIHTLDKRLEKYMDSLELYFTEPEMVGGNLVKIKLLELLFYLSVQGHQIVEQLLDVRECFRANITTVVEENIMNSLSLHQLAVMAGRSLSSFRRDFLAIYNMPPSQWIRQKRLEKARQLLSSTTMTVTDVCFTSGFENIAHFSRLFKSYFGYTPSQCRSTDKAA